jgi:hypothetical protein
MSRTHTFNEKDKVVFVVSGSGMKNLKVLDSSSMNFYHADLSTLEATLLSTIE